MQKHATYYFNPQDYTACKELREAYINEADGDVRRALLAMCIDMAALEAYVADVEELAVSNGADFESLTAVRPCSLKTSGFRLPPRIQPEKRNTVLPPEAEWADEVRRRLQAWTGHQPSPAQRNEYGVFRLIESDHE